MSKKLVFYAIGLLLTVAVVFTVFLPVRHVSAIDLCEYASGGPDGPGGPDCRLTCDDPTEAPIYNTNCTPVAGRCSRLDSLANCTGVPTIVSISPNSITAGSADFTLTVYGTNFQEVPFLGNPNGGVLYWNGSPRPTVVISPTQINATTSAADVVVQGNNTVKVSKLFQTIRTPIQRLNSNSVNFSVTAPPSPPTVSISALPTRIILGASTTIRWSSTNAITCNATGSGVVGAGWSGPKATSSALGESNTPTATGTATYSLACTGPGGTSAPAGATVEVVSPFCSADGNPAPQTVTLTNSGGGTLNWRAASNQPWLLVSPTSGSLASGASTPLTVSVRQERLTPAPPRTGTITVSGPPASPQDISVTFTINP